MTKVLVGNELMKTLRASLLSRPDLRQTGSLSPMPVLLEAADPVGLSRSASLRMCEPGEVVFDEGAAGDALYVIWSGRVAVLKGDLSSPTILAYLDAGHIFGEMALLENRPRSATVVAMEETRLLEVNQQGFDSILRTSPEVGRGIMAMLSANLRRTTETTSLGERRQRRLTDQVSALEEEKHRLEDLQRLRQETSDLIIHDLRNPLSTIALSLRMLGMVLPEATRQEHADILSIAQANVTRMQSLVDSLLEVSRIEAGENTLKLQMVDLRELAQGVVQQQSVLAQGAVQIHLNFTAHQSEVQADRDKIERILSNLLDNAIKFSPKGGDVVIEMMDGDEEVLVSVSDDGPGIPPAEREHVFDRFAQVQGQKTARRGFGLGLNYCRLAVELHGGRIWVEPGEHGQGSKFVFTLPGRSEPRMGMD